MTSFTFRWSFWYPMWSLWVSIPSTLHTCHRTLACWSFTSWAVPSTWRLKSFARPVRTTLAKHLRVMAAASKAPGNLQLQTAPGQVGDWAYRPTTSTIQNIWQLICRCTCISNIVHIWHTLCTYWHNWLVFSNMGVISCTREYSIHMRCSHHHDTVFCLRTSLNSNDLIEI